MYVVTVRMIDRVRTYFENTYCQGVLTVLIGYWYTTECCFEFWELGASRRTSASSRTKMPFTEPNARASNTTVRTRRLLWAGALLRMGDHRLPKRVMSGELENAGKRGPGGRRKSGRTAWQMIFGYLASRGTGKPPHSTLGHGTTTVQEGGCRFMAACVREEENASNQRQKKR